MRDGASLVNSHLHVRQKQFEPTSYLFLQAMARSRGSAWFGPIDKLGLPLGLRAARTDFVGNLAPSPNPPGNNEQRWYEYGQNAVRKLHCVNDRTNDLGLLNNLERHQSKRDSPQSPKSTAWGATAVKVNRCAIKAANAGT
jgi:hypothetical protein